MSDPKRIERVAGVSPREFRRRFLKDPRPVVLTDVVSAWPASKKWSFEWLQKEHGALRLPVEFGGIGHDITYSLREMTMAEYVDTLRDRSHASAEPGYLANVDLLPLIPSLRDEFAFPEVSPWYGLFGLGAIGFWIGPDGKYSQLHQDFLHNFHAVVVGRKRFRLYSPRHSRKMMVIREQWQSAYSAREYVDATATNAEMPVDPDYDDVIEPGEMLFLPFGWWHAVTGIGDFMSLNLFWPTWWMLGRMLAKGGPSAVRALVRRSWT